jgi:hypothetical protein
VVDIGHVVGKIGLIAQGVFPVAALPDARRPIRPGLAAYAQPVQPFDKVCLDGLPARRVVIIARWQRPDAVQVIG